MEQRRTDFGVFVRLSGRMFLQFAIWGAWAVLIAGHMQNLGFSGTQMSPRDIRASSQALLLFVTNGFGMLVGHIVSGRVHEYFADPAGGHAWAKIFMVPIVITVIAAIAFIVLFNEQKYQAEAEAIEQSPTNA